MSAQITLPFRPFFCGPMLSGHKIMTCRSKRYGDTFQAFGAQFVPTHVMRMRLGYVIQDCYFQGRVCVPRGTDENLAGHSPRQGRGS